MFSPIPLFIDVIRTKNISKLPNLAYPAMAIMQLGWSIYGLIIENGAIFRASSMQMVASVFYATLAFILRKQALKILYFYLILAGLTVIYSQTPAVILGTLACIIQLISSSTNLELIVRFLLKISLISIKIIKILNKNHQNYEK